MELRLTRTERRLLAAGALLNGLAHLAFPGLLTDLVRMTYDAALDVSFVPRDETDRRVRALGVSPRPPAVPRAAGGVASDPPRLSVPERRGGGARREIWFRPA
jgi:hypothetical protein